MMTYFQLKSPLCSLAAVPASPLIITFRTCIQVDPIVIFDHDHHNNAAAVGFLPKYITTNHREANSSISYDISSDNT